MKVRYSLLTALLSPFLVPSFIAILEQKKVLRFLKNFLQLSGRTVNADGRTGVNEAKAFDGINSKLYYMTPSKFFDGAEVGRTPADTTRGSVNVKGPNGVHKTKASGIRIFLPDIPDVGIIRQRYPIFPVHGEGMYVLCVYVYFVTCRHFIIYMNT